MKNKIHFYDYYQKITCIIEKKIKLSMNSYRRIQKHIGSIDLPRARVYNHQQLQFVFYNASRYITDYTYEKYIIIITHRCAAWT